MQDNNFRSFLAVISTLAIALPLLFVPLHGLAYGQNPLPPETGTEVGEVVTDVKDGVIPWIIEGFHVWHDLVMDLIKALIPWDVPVDVLSLLATVITIVVTAIAVKRQIGDTAKIVVICVAIFLVFTFLVPYILPVATVQAGPFPAPTAGH